MVKGDIGNVEVVNMTPTQQKELSYSTQQRELSYNTSQSCSILLCKCVFLEDVLLAGGGSTAMPDLLRDSSVDLKIKMSTHEGILWLRCA